VARHAARGVRIALVRVAARLEPDPPRRLAREGDGRLPVQAPADQVEVVDRGLVLDLDPVGPGLDRLDVPAALLDLDREARADLALEAYLRAPFAFLWT
jgi:hypothetical protein